VWVFLQYLVGPARYRVRLAVNSGPVRAKRVSNPRRYWTLSRDSISGRTNPQPSIFPLYNQRSEVINSSRDRYFALRGILSNENIHSSDGRPT
jgi:hypothetical protein